ncbi:hypothetical protein AAF712_016167 [Marasmius tenuissimus]|uniref:Uncharacterized protein n=1 Tax=Marasmius tenuissimus TaxID=585030 RepID=A0ABR2Z7J2_9AGAR
MEDYYAHVNPPDDPPKDMEKVKSKLGGAHFSIGSKLPSTTFKEFAHAHSPPGGETEFRIGLGDFLSKALQAHGIELPGRRWIHYKADDEIVPFQFLKINYESKETWQLATDYLRCNPNFYNSPRYDFVIFYTAASPVFAQLKYLLVTEVGGEKYPIAYVQSYKVISMGRRTQSDRHFGILRVQKEKLEFISVHSIIWGALVAHSLLEDSDERLVVDTVDYDMFLRVRSHWPGYTDITA